jgi:hypothetical protein
MCTGRIWRASDLSTFLFCHPIVGRLCQRLVFAGVSADGRITCTFRPLDDGSCTSVADEAVRIADVAAVRVAHRVLMKAEEAAAWKQHFVDYKVEPLFEQLDRPLAGVAPGQDAIGDRAGYLLDFFTLRAVAERLGYQLGPLARHGLWSYRKLFRAAGITAIIRFAGRPLAQSPVPCALIDLQLTQQGSSQAMPLQSAPAVLLSETWSDLRALAAAGPGFDPDWQKKTLGWE